MMKTDFRIAKADLTWLAKEWEHLVSKVEYPTRSFALSAFHVVLSAFLRGRGMRMGSAQGFHKHVASISVLMTEVVERVISDEAKETWFPTLVRMGVDSQEGAFEWIKQAGQAEGPGL